MTDHQRQDDQAIAAKIREIKPPGCRCYIYIDQELIETHVTLDPDYRCPIHYPETSTTLKNR